MAITWTAIKDPDEVKDYGLDWSAMLNDDTILTSAWDIVSGEGLVIGVTSNTETSTTVWFSAGAAGTSYQVRNRVTTAGGRTYDQTAKLKVKEK